VLLDLSAAGRPAPTGAAGEGLGVAELLQVGGGQGWRRERAASGCGRLRQVAGL
jgi:hypothetical protein